MRLRYSLLLSMASVLVVSALQPSAREVAQVPAEESGALALVGAKIYPSPEASPILNGTVLIQGGKIVAVGKSWEVKLPPGVSVLDCKKLFVTAGFQNSHVHFTEPKWADAAHQPAEQLTRQLQEMLSKYGFTTVVDTGSSLENTVALRSRIESGEVAGSRILTAGLPLYPPDGIPYYVRSTLSPGLLKILPQPATGAEAVKAVNADIAGGADIIKLFAGSWVVQRPGGVKPMPAEVAKAAVAEAHKQGKLVFAHPSNVEGFRVALEAGVDVLAHAVEDTHGWNNSFLQQMKKAHMSLIPALWLFSREDNTAEILEQVHSFSKGGGQILFGTDVGYLTAYDPTSEYVLMQRAGLYYSQILASLTTAPSTRFGEAGTRGQIAPGMDADIVVLDADPMRDVRAFAKVHYTIRRGTVIYARQ